MNKEKSCVEVVAAVIKSRDKYLCVQRGLTKFPYTSFKFEGNESLQKALEREIREELECAIEVDELLLTVDHSYPDFNIRMHCFLCSASDKKFTLNEHINARWLTPEEMLHLDWAEADKPIVRLLTK
jgi:8-oxo-dGTP diphosphatase